MAEFQVQTAGDYHRYLNQLSNLNGFKVVETFERKEDAQIVAIVRVKPTKYRKLAKHCTNAVLVERQDFIWEVELQLEPEKAQHLLFSVANV